MHIENMGRKKKNSKRNKKTAPPGGGGGGGGGGPTTSVQKTAVQRLMDGLGYQSDKTVAAYQGMSVLMGMIPAAVEAVEQLNLANKYCAAVAIGACKEKLAPGKVKQCSRCNFSRYCKVECQRKHWPEHKKFCVGLAGRKTALAESVLAQWPDANVAALSEAAELALHSSSHHPAGAKVVISFIFDFSEKYEGFFPRVQIICDTFNRMFGRQGMTPSVYVSLEKALGCYKKNQSCREAHLEQERKRQENMKAVQDLCQEIHTNLLPLIQGIGLARVGTSKQFHRTNSEMLNYLLKQCTDSDYFCVDKPYENIPIYLACTSECIAAFKFDSPFGKSVVLEETVTKLDKLFELVRKAFVDYEKAYDVDHTAPIAASDDELLKEARLRSSYTIKMRTEMNKSAEKYSGVGEWRPNALGVRLFENTYGLQRLGKGLPVLPMDDSQTKKNYDVVMVQ